MIAISRFFLKCLALFLIVFSCPFISGQHRNITQYSVIDGLSNEQIFDIMEDQKGYLWIATNGGSISVFDGKSFQYIDSDKGLTSNRVLSLFESSNGEVWIGTFHGLFKYKDQEVHKVLGTEIRSKVFSISEDQNNLIWLGTDEGVIVVKDTIVNRFSESDGLNSNIVRAIHVDKNNKIWIGTENGINQIYNQEIDSEVELYNFPMASYRVIYEDKVGDIWFGTKKEGVFRFSGNKLTEIGNAKAYTIYDLVSDKKGRIWLATNEGAFFLKEDKFQKAWYTNELGELDVLYSINCGFEGDVWLGTSNSGLIKVGAQSTIKYNKSFGLTGNETSISKVKEGKKYIATDNGVNVVQNNQIVKVFFKGSKVNDLIVENDLIVAATDDFVGVVSKGREIKLLSGMATLSLSEWDSDNKVFYAGTFGHGVYKVDKDFHAIQYLNGFVVFDQINFGDYLFVATNKGLFVNKDAIFERINSVNYSVKSLAVTEGGIIWMSGSKGLVAYDFIYKRILPTNFWNAKIGKVDIVALNVTPDMYLWVGTQKGIYKIDLNPLLMNEAKAVIDYTNNKNLSFGECLPNSITSTLDGQIFIGTSSGLLEYNFDNSLADKKSNRTYINGIRIRFEDYDFKPYQNGLDKRGLPKDLVLPYQDNHVTFDFIGLTYNYSNVVKYKYILEGLDTVWSSSNSQASVTFSAIPPGDYTFKVKSSFDGENWISNNEEFSFKIMTPFYMTGWFYSLIALFIIIVAAFLHRLRLHNLNRSKRLLEEQVMARTVEIVRQKEIIEQKNKDITDSIKYAKKIQEAVLPISDELKRYIPDSFILYQPRDIVSGDFYWFNALGNKIVVAAVDCTGHGVPGALMSMIGNTLMKEIVIHSKITDPAKIISRLNEEVQNSLKQKNSAFSDHDGMDVGIIEVDLHTLEARYAGANRPCFLVKNSELIEHKGDNYPVGGIYEQEKIFTNVEFKLDKGDRVFLFTDGYVDQFGGANGKKFMTKRFKDLIESNSNMPIKEQADKISAVFQSWKGKEDQVDDVLVIGLQF